MPGVAAYGVNGIGLFLMLVSFAHTGGLTGAEVGIAGNLRPGAARPEAIFGDQAVREMAARARKALLARVDGLYAAERARFQDAITEAGNLDDAAERLDRAAAGRGRGGTMSPDQGRACHGRHRDCRGARGGLRSPRRGCRVRW